MNNFNSHGSLSSAPLIGVDERSEAFIDDIMEGIVDPATDSLLRLSGQKPSQLTPISPSMVVRPPLNIKNHLRDIIEEARSIHDSDEATRRDKELSLYALDVENIEELI